MPKPHWPLLIASAVLLVIICVQLTLSIRRNADHFVYALDDPYIHMAIARNFARYGVWGVTRYEFSSSTSALLWTLLLVPIYLFTSSPSVPLLLNIICALLFLAAADFLLQDSIRSPFVRLGVLISLLFLVPLPPLIFSGMEHTAHITLCLMLVFAGASCVVAADESKSIRQRFAPLLVLATVAPLVRYESLFVVFIVAALLCFRRRFLLALLVASAAVLPLAIYGFISWSNGFFFLPNPLLLKGTLPTSGLLPFIGNTFAKVKLAPHLVLLWLLAIWLLVEKVNERRTIWELDQILLLVFAGGTVLHLLFAGVGWFYRYEAYLVALGIVIDVYAIWSLVRPKKISGRQSGQILSLAVTLALATTAGLLLALRSIRAIDQTVAATHNIYEQQYQMARFLSRYYEGGAVAANDIGAINFMADIRCLDLWGLGSAQVTRAKLANQYNTHKIDELSRARNVRIALIYSGWFEQEGGVPAQWVKLGEWAIADCVVCGNPIVSFYAVQPAEIEPLRHNLGEFSRELPDDVSQAGLYRQPDE